jgi:hypothetical protein
MRFEGYDDELPDEEEVIDEFLGENPRARELRLMRAALEQRREGLLRERERTKEERERAQFQSKIKELDRQIAALKQEESITEFVENSVRVTLHKPALEEEE